MGFESSFGTVDTSIALVSLAAILSFAKMKKTHACTDPIAGYARSWSDFRSGKAMDRTVVGILCMSMALSILLAPTAHPAARLPNQRDRDNRRYVEIAFRVADECRGPFDLVPETVERIQFYNIAVNYFAYGGYPELSFQVIGTAVRLGKALQIFDEQGWERESLSPLDIELRRRLAWDIAYTDR